MSKYDFQLDLSKETSTGMILDKIEKGSTVLEFGCAAGRMTEYLREELDCRVYIVEQARDDYALAARFAVDGVCGDAEKLTWVKKFAGIEFDVILFADVLEHLAAPEKVFAAASKLLKDSGKIIVSLPNITHNDVILKALDDRFDYTETGILDENHVRFWGLYNIAELAGESRVCLKTVQGAYCPMGETEQAPALGKKPLLESMLATRPWGTAYQFVAEFDKNPKNIPSYAAQRPFVWSNIYLDTGRGFNTDEIFPVKAFLTEAGTLAVSCEISNAEKIRRLRFDPIEDKECIVKKLSVGSGERLFPVTHGGLDLGETGVFLPGSDPQMFAEVDAAGALTFEAEFELWGEAFFRDISLGLLNISGSLDEELKAVSARAETESARVGLLQAEIQELKTANAAYIHLANCKDKLSIEDQDRIARQEALINDQRTEICSKAESIEALQASVSALEAELAAKTQELATGLVRMPELEAELARQANIIAYYEELKSHVPKFALKLFGKCRVLWAKIKGFFKKS